MFNPGDLVLVKALLFLSPSLGPDREGRLGSTLLLSTPIAGKVTGTDSWIHYTQVNARGS